MRNGAPLGADRDPVLEVRIVPSAGNPLSLTVSIELADHVASCCVSADEAFVEFYGGGHHLQSVFGFKEGRPGHRFVTTLTVPSRGLYSYRIIAKVLGRFVNREGTYDV